MDPSRHPKHFTLNPLFIRTTNTLVVVVELHVSQTDGSLAAKLTVHSEPVHTRKVL